MARKPKGESISHIELPTHNDLEKRGVTDVLKRDQLILLEAILNVYATVTEDPKPLRLDPKCIESASAFVCELSQIRYGDAFFSQLEGLATIMRGEHAYRDVCGAAIKMLMDRGVTQDEFDKFVCKHRKEK